MARLPIKVYLLLVYPVVIAAGFFYTPAAQAQLTLNVQKQDNQYCNGCSFSGGSILINEVMISPLSGDGSIYGTDILRRGEWIELYNPDSCCPRDISCFYLGNNATDGNPPLDYPGGFELPQGTVVPPSGFVIVRGLNAPAVPANLLLQNGGKTIELVIGSDQQLCMGNGERLWFPNAGGWFAFYDQDGNPQDAICWNDTLNFEHFTSPCNPQGGCTLAEPLPSFAFIPPDKMNYISQGGPVPGMTFKRVPDGGPWAVDIGYNATYGDCNILPCPQVNACDGNVSVIVSGGTPPYTYHWNDCRNQSGPVATGLCAGTYCVTVTDAVGIQDSACTSLENLAPVVTITPFSPLCLYADSVALIQGSPSGGYYTGNGVSDGIFYPEMAGVGDHYIYYVVDNGVGCYGIDSAMITVYPAPIPIPQADPDTICTGESFMLAAHATGGSGAGYTYWWKGPGNFSSGDPDNLFSMATTHQGGYYSLMVTDSRNCRSAYPDSIRIVVYPPLQTNVILQDTIYLCEGEIYTIRLIHDNTIMYTWQDGSIAENYPVSNPGTYTVMAYYPVCFISDTIVFLPCTDFWVPNAFSPDGDKINDFFLPASSQQLREYELSVFNRWGELVFKTNDIYQGWDGRFKGEICKSDVYVYKIIFLPMEGGKRKKQGMVVLLR